MHRALTPVVLVALCLLGAPSAWSAPKGLERVQYGEDALAFSAGFIRDSLPIHGTVSLVTGDSQTRGNKRLLARGDRIYLTFRNHDEVKHGDVFTLYRHIHPVRHPVNGSFLGNLFVMIGIVRVVDVNERPATVEVVRSYDSVVPGDRAMRFVPLSDAEPRLAEETFTDGGVIVEVPPARTLIAQGQVVYIDKGSEDGVRPGDALEAYRQHDGFPRRVIGELRVLTVEPTTASAVIKSSNYPFLRGDRVALKRAAPVLVSVPEPDPQEMPEPVVVEQEPPLGEQEPVVAEGDRAEQPQFVLEGVVDSLHFESGQASLKPEGRETLERVAELLKEVPEQPVHVQGHTDDVPIGPTLKRTYPSNWELSQARANTVVRYLIEKAGVRPELFSAVGYADTQPVASNANEPGRSKNRRVEILVNAPGAGAAPGAMRGEPLESPVTEPAPADLPPLEFSDESLRRSRLSTKEQISNAFPSRTPAGDSGGTSELGADPSEEAVPELFEEPFEPFATPPPTGPSPVAPSAGTPNAPVGPMPAH